MKAMITIMLAFGLVGVAAAYDLGNRAPIKPVVTYPENVPNPERQGGDTIPTATLIPALPYSDSGTTAGYTNNYDEVCPYGNSTAPDVVYSYAATSTQAVDIDLCGSSYDTKLYVYDAGLNVVGCNDDFYFSDPCGTYVSKLEGLPVVMGMTYYIVIDGYGGDYGEYQLDITVTPPCQLTCPPEGQYEGEPPLVDEYVDNYNGGCNTNPTHPFQTVVRPVFCGESGWYLVNGANYRDTDWLIAAIPSSGALEVTIQAESPTYLFELTTGECDQVAVIQSIAVDPCSESFMTIVGTPGSTVRLWVGPTTYAPPAGSTPQMYDYMLNFNFDDIIENVFCSEPGWRITTPVAQPPSPRYGAAMALDESRSVLVLFGGRSADVASDETWVWYGDTWTRQFPVLSPAARFDHAMAYDRARDRLVLFGGYTLGQLHGDTWEWDGNTWIPVSEVGPPPRTGHVMAFDENLQKVILFGGYDGTYRNDTWAWDGSASEWIPLAVEGPSPRAYAAAASDPFNSRVVLFGGRTTGGPATGLSDTWEWDGQQWTQATELSIFPAARSRHAMTYSAVCGQVLLVAGDIAGLSSPDTTWTWNGARWHPEPEVLGTDLNLASPAMAYDFASSRVIAFGGLALDAPIGPTCDTRAYCSPCDDEIAVLDAQGNVVLPATLDPDGPIVYEELEENLGPTSRLYPEFETDADSWYDKWPCLTAIGGEIPAEATTYALDDSLMALGITMLAQEIVDSLGVWDETAKALVESQPDGLPEAPAVGPPPPYTPPASPYCPPADRSYVFGGRDIVFIQGFQPDHILDRIFGNVPGAQVDWEPPTTFPGSTQNPEFYNQGGYYREIADTTWSNHIHEFLTGKYNRYLIVAWPTSERFEVGIQAVLTQISDAMRFGTNVEDPTGRHENNFGTPSFVIVSHSGGGPLSDISLWAAEHYPNLGAQFIADRCKAHVALVGAFGGSRYATAALALSPVFGLTGGALNSLITVVNAILRALDKPTISNIHGFAPLVNSSLVDFCPAVMKYRWGEALDNTNVPTVLANGGHPTKHWPLKHVFHPGFDDGVCSQNSVGANPRTPLLWWPQGFQVLGGAKGLIKTYDMGIAGIRAVNYYLDQVVDPLLCPETSLYAPFVAAMEHLYQSPTGMIQSVGKVPVGFDPRQRHNGHLSFMASAADHWTVRSAEGYPDYQKTGSTDNWEEVRTMLGRDLPAWHALYSPGEPDFCYAGDDQPLLDDSPPVVRFSKSRYILFRIKIFGRVFEKKWHIWRREYCRPWGSRELHICDYVYKYILPDDNGIPKCDYPNTVGGAPGFIELHSASPNPFNSMTAITFSLPAEAHATLRIYDIAGRLVRTLIDDVRPAGMNEIKWDGTDNAGRIVASGTYLTRLTVNGEHLVQPVSLLK